MARAQRVVAGVTAAWRAPWLKLAAKGAAGLIVVALLGHVGARSAAHLPSLRDAARNARPLEVAREPALPVAGHTGHMPVAVTAASGSASASARAVRAPCGDELAGKIVVNEAGIDALVALPGVGRKRAEAIVKLRERLGGRFRRLRDLMRVKGIGPRSFKRLEPRLLLDRPKPAPSS